jgi:hypothetical protein
MQINPKRDNDLMWTFNECGKFDLTTSEYAGPAQYDHEGGDKMFVADAIEVIGCDGNAAMKKEGSEK